MARHEVMFLRTRVVTETVRRVVDIPDHLANGDPAQALLWCTHTQMGALSAVGYEQDGLGGVRPVKLLVEWTTTPEGPPVVQAVRFDRIDDELPEEPRNDELDPDTAEVGDANRPDGDPAWDHLEPPAR